MSWSVACVIFLLTAGFSKLSTVILNRMLSRPQTRSFIQVTESMQLALIPVYVLLLLDYFLRRFDGRIWNSLASFDGMLIVIGYVGLLMLIFSTLRFQLYRPPRCQISNDSHTIDFRKLDTHGSWRETLVGAGPMRRIALLPGNEQFQLEVSIKTYALPRLPKEWDGLSMVQLTDCHFRGAVTSAYFQAVCEQAIALKPDLFLFTGDLLDDPSLLHWFPETFGQLKAPLGQFFILGNHDRHYDTTVIRQEFERHNWIDLASRSYSLAAPKSGPPIILAGDETPWLGTHAVLPDNSRDYFQILLSHTPDNIHWAQNHGIDLMLAGHTHGGQIRLPVLGPVYSPSQFGCRFASGVFWLEPTLMYVSRGLSGREPIRYGCLPELTKLVLRTVG